jgi:hypothetical protein
MTEQEVPPEEPATPELPEDAPEPEKPAETPSEEDAA